MVSKIGSLIALLVAVLAIFFLLNKGYVFSYNPITILIQVCAAALMIWSRITFGLRSFHASANATEGGLVTNGPYRWLRHPIYSAVIYFFWASVISYPYLETIAGVSVITAALFVRMLLEEKFLSAAYPLYAAYSEKTKRIIPFIL